MCKIITLTDFSGSKILLNTTCIVEIEEYDYEDYDKCYSSKSRINTNADVKSDNSFYSVRETVEEIIEMINK